MEPLQLIREFMTSYCMCAQMEAAPRLVQLGRYMLFGIMMFLFNFGWISSVDFIIKYVKTDLSAALYAIFQIAAEFSASYTLFVTYLHRKSVMNVFIKFKEIREKVVDRKKPYYKSFEDTDELCHKLTKYMVQGMITVYIIMTIIQTILNTLYCYITRSEDGMDAECLFVPYKFTTPFIDQKNLLQRSFLIAFCAVQAVVFTFLTITFVSFFISTSLQFDAMRIYMKGLVDELNDNIENGSNNSNDNIETMLCDMVRFHVAAKDIFWSNASIFNRFSFVQILSAVVFMSSNILNMDLAFKNPSVDIGVILYVTVLSLSNLYLYCYFGAYTTSTFAKFPHYFFYLKWYKIPVKYQKYLILLLGNSNQPLHYDGFKLISLNLETFAKVLKTSASYYLILKAAAFE